MSTVFKFWQGKGKWIRPQQINEWGKRSMVLYPNKEALEEIQSLNLRNTIKKDDDGYHITISQPASKEIKGKIVAFPAPKVVDVDGKEIKESIGNGSDVTVKVALYKYGQPGSSVKNNNAIRWEALRVDNLVPFVPNTDFTDVEKDQVEGLAEAPEHLF